MNPRCMNPHCCHGPCFVTAISPVGIRKPGSGHESHWMKTEGSMGFAGGIAPPQTTILEIPNIIFKISEMRFLHFINPSLRIQARVPMPINLEFYSHTPFTWDIPGFLQMGCLKNHRPSSQTGQTPVTPGERVGNHDLWLHPKVRSVSQPFLRVAKWVEGPLETSTQILPSWLISSKG